MQRSTKRTSKQDITKDTETENRLTVTGGGGDFRGKGEGFVGTIMKDAWCGNGRVVGRAEGWAGVAGKRQKTVLEQQYFFFN